MSIADIAHTMLSRFGDKTVIEEKGVRREISAVIQPMLYKNKMYLSGVLSEAGYFDGGHYLMIAPAKEKIEDYRNTRVLHSGNTYRIKKVEVISALGLDLYIWAVLIPSAKAVEDDYEERNDAS